MKDNAPFDDITSLQSSKTVGLNKLLGAVRRRERIRNEEVEGFFSLPFAEHSLISSPVISSVCD